MTLDEWLHATRTPVQTIASLCDVHPTTVLRWRAMQRKPRPRQMAALTRATGWQVRAQDFGIVVHRGSPYFLPHDDVPGPGVAVAQVEASPSAGAHAAGATPHPSGHRDPSIPSQAGFAESRHPFGPAAVEAEAAALGLDAAAIAQQALRAAIRAEKARRWLEENREAIKAWNRWTDENPLPLAEYRMF